GTARIEANGALAIPNKEMRAAPRMKASQTRVGGPGRSSAAMTSQSTSNAGAIAATPIDVGRACSNNIGKLYLAYENGRKVSRLQEKSNATPCRHTVESGVRF